MSARVNPYTSSDSDRHNIWDILVAHDFDAFVEGDWGRLEHDFLSDTFVGIHAHDSVDPKRWTLAFPSVSHYRAEWLRQFEKLRAIALRDTTLRDFLYDSCTLEDIDVVDDRAVARKEFDGTAVTTNEVSITLRFQSVYHLARKDGWWKIAGFVGYLPNLPSALDPVRATASTPW